MSISSHSLAKGPVPGSDWDAKARKKAIFRFSEPVHQGWNPRVDREFGNFDYLLGEYIYMYHHFRLLTYSIGADVGLFTASAVALLTVSALG